MEPKQKILIVDDSEINRAMLKEILGEGYEYLEAENGLRAIEILRRRTDIALVLLDLIMPEMDGFDVLRVMQCYAWQEEIPVIVISAAEDTRSVERAYDMGVADYIRRPFERVMVHHTKQIRTYFFLKVRSDLFFISIHIDRSPYNKKTSKNTNFDCVT